MPGQSIIEAQAIASAQRHSVALFFHASLVAQRAPAHSQCRCGPARKRGEVP
jgi:hypothetical protein